MIMNYCQIIKDDVANGPGIRLSLFVSGCSNRCEGCFQPKTWDPDYGKLFTASVLENILTELSKPYYTGITLLGGDPFYPSNLTEVASIINAIHLKLDNTRTIWIYTGYTYEQLLSKDDPTINRILDQSDVLVDGPFILSRKNMFIAFRGSDNQRIIDLKKTAMNNHTPVIITEYERSHKHE